MMGLGWLVYISPAGEMTAFPVMWAVPLLFAAIAIRLFWKAAAEWLGRDRLRDALKALERAANRPQV